ncbi:hypothetical protein [Sphingobacterium chuzhouense]|uniref:DUF3325 domain-containing protein n=1 Tax=Sphingobacterium chuzhouense TaxID=1742264 RepID=A0ABR7XXK2_9SPHI|nr:hypothetical protein [Sphingobacterium chuzhouense]MBD1423783.1 hypothetical protein [Sphingobacterium chuzhouense]
MYSLLFLVLFFGCYLLYITSKKAKLGKVPPRLRALAQPAKNAKLIASILFVFSWLVIIIDQGVGSGTFAFGGYIMTILCIVVLLNPLNYIHWKHLLGLFVLSILIEIFIF